MQTVALAMCLSRPILRRRSLTQAVTKYFFLILCFLDTIFLRKRQNSFNAVNVNCKVCIECLRLSQVAEMKFVKSGASLSSVSGWMPKLRRRNSAISLQIISSKSGTIHFLRTRCNGLLENFDNFRKLLFDLFC